ESATSTSIASAVLPAATSDAERPRRGEIAIGDRDPRAFVREGLDDRLADAAGASGDDRHLAFELHLPLSSRDTLEGHGPGDRRPVHPTALRQRVVLYSEVL